MKCVWLITLLVLGHCQGSLVRRDVGPQDECEEGELQEMQSEFNQCANTLTYQFESEKDEEMQNVEESLCNLITSTVTECGTKWERCHTNEEVRSLQDTQLEALMFQYSEVSLADCSVVNAYLSSGRQEANSKGKRCSDGQALAAQRRFGDCSHKISDDTYNNLGPDEEYYGEEEGEEEEEREGNELTGEEKEKVYEETRQMLCDTLVTIGETCMKELQTCFRREDVERTTTSHLESMKGFLISIAGSKARPDSLDSCDAASGLDFGPEDATEEEFEEDEDNFSYEIIEDKELSAAEMEENKAVIEKALNKPRNELSDEPQKDTSEEEQKTVVQETEVKEEQKKVKLASDVDDGHSRGHSLTVCSTLVSVLSILAVTRLPLV